MSKGETLGELIAKNSLICQAMRQIFIQRGMTTPDLSTLPEEEYKQWFSLKEKADSLASEINSIIINNKEKQVMVRDCKDWRVCRQRAREAVKYSAQRAIWTVMGVYGADYAARMEKGTLVEMVYLLMIEHGMKARRQDADTAVEEWYQEGMV